MREKKYFESTKEEQTKFPPRGGNGQDFDSEVGWGGVKGHL